MLMEVQIQTRLEEKFIERFLNVVRIVHKDYDRTFWPSSAVLHYTKHSEQFELRSRITQ